MNKPTKASRSLYSLIAGGLGMPSLTASLRVFTPRQRMIFDGTGIGIVGVDSGIDAIHDSMDDFDRTGSGATGATLR